MKPKHGRMGMACRRRVDLKRKEPRLRDWNRQIIACDCVCPVSLLKRKEPRLRDWNFEVIRQYCGTICPTWKEKNLDYEIETLLPLITRAATEGLKRKEPRLRDWNVRTGHFSSMPVGLEKKRTSITRLKHQSSLRWYRVVVSLEKKRTSITRLKRSNSASDGKDVRSAWKEKNLDYEIETGMSQHFCCWQVLLEKKRASITRLKLKKLGVCVFSKKKNLKRKEPRLRDWNLAPRREAPIVKIDLKRKEPRLRDWNNAVDV